MRENALPIYVCPRPNCPVFRFQILKNPTINSRGPRDLRRHNNGADNLARPPGTGQTSHLRYLVHELRSAHRFYYLPVTVYPILASPTAVDLWASENEKHKKKIGINRGRRNPSHGESVGQSTVAFQSSGVPVGPPGRTRQRLRDSEGVLGLFRYGPTKIFHSLIVMAIISR